MTDAILYGVFFLAFGYLMFNGLRRAVHIYQLSSYQTPSYFRSICDKRSWFVPFVLIFIIGVIVLLGTDLQKKIKLLSVLYLIGGLIITPRKAKKPLVFTARVYRLFITCYVISALFLLLAWVVFMNAKLVVELTIVLYAIIPFYILLCNIVARPIETAVGNYYINDAVSMLKSARKNGLKIIGVTGSFGKTSVKHYLQVLLGADKSVLITPGSYNTPFGVVRTVREHLRPTHEVFVCEMGARHVGDIKELCELAEPDCGIITSVGEQHLETFHSLANIKKTKLELADSVNADGGDIYINGDSVRDAKALGYKNVCTYGLSPENDYHAENITLSKSAGYTFTVTTPDGESAEFTTELLGEHSVINILGAIAVANHGYMIPLKDLVPRVKRLEPAEHRLAMKRIHDGVVIDDSYNSNPKGAEAAIKTLSAFEGYKILITPGMVELGKAQDKCNYEFGKSAATVCDYVVLVGRLQTRKIHEGLIDGGLSPDRIYTAVSFPDGYEKAQSRNTHGLARIMLIENDLPDNY